MKLENKLLIKLHTINKLSNAKIIKLFENISCEELNLYKSAELRNIGWSELQIHQWLKFDEKLLDLHATWLTHKNNHFVSIFSNDYPNLLKEIVNPPIFLCIQGNLNAIHTKQIAIVGSRNNTSYGKNCAIYFTKSLITAGFTITSGLAIGIDGIAHQTAIDNEGQTIAVLGSGFHYLYPKKHCKLAENIVANDGAVISEFLINSPPIANNFPRRNRVISGLSIATLVIEAGIHSGSLITAKYALEQNREIFAVPSIIFDEYNKGCHWLIKQGAILVEHIDDILENLNMLNSIKHTNFNQPSKNIIQPAYPLLYQHISYTPPILIDDLISLLDIPIAELMGQLLELELQNLIKMENGGYVKT